jgi:ketosteroid isomerase-like protein
MKNFMNKKESPHKRAIRQVIDRINDLWFKKRYDEIGDHLSEDVVIAPPGFGERIHGRDAYVQSYREYDQSAITSEFSPGEPEIDIVGDTAVAICPFYVVYELGGKKYQENGRDILVFSKSKGEWKVAWRTMQTESAK